MKNIFIFAILLIVAAFPGQYKIKINDTNKASEFSGMIKEINLFFEIDHKGNAFNPFDNKSYIYNFTNGSYTFILQNKNETMETNIILNEQSPELILLIPFFPRLADNNAKRLDEIYIKTGKKDYAQISIPATQAKFIPGTGGDALRSIASFPGVVSGGAFSTVLYVRGGDAEDMAYKFGLFPISTPFHSLGTYSVFSEILMESINFYPGAYPLQFKASQGALVEIVPKTTFEKKAFVADIDANLAVVKGDISIALGPKMQLSLGGKRSYYEAYIKLINSIFKTSFNFIPFYYDANLKFDWDINKNNSIHLSGLLYKDKLTLNQNSIHTTNIITVTNSSGVTNKVIETNYMSGTSMNNENKYNLEGIDYNFHNGIIDNQVNFYRYYEKNSTLNFNSASESTVTKYSLINSTAISFADWYKARCGFDITYEEQPYLTTSYHDSSFVTNTNMSRFEKMKAMETNALVTNTHKPDRTVISAYLGNEIKIGKLLIDLGLRGEINTINRMYILEPRTRINFEITKNADLYTRIGKYSQTKSLYPYLTANPQLKNEYAWHYVLGSEFLIFKNYLVKTEIYYKHLYDQVLKNPNYSDYNTAQEKLENPQYVNQGEGEVTGFETMIRRRLTDRLFGWISYTYSHSLEKQYSAESAADQLGILGEIMSRGSRENRNGQGGIQPGNSDRSTDELTSSKTNTTAWYIHPNDTPHVLNFIASYEPVKGRLKTGVKYTFKSGALYTPYTSVKKIYNENTGQTHTVLEKSSAVNSARLPSRHEVSVRIDGTLLHKKCFDLSIYLDIWNLQWLWYKNVTGYTYDTSKIQTADDIEKNKKAITDYPIIPLLGISMKF